MSTVIKSEKYYLDTIVFKVENTLFRVPRWYFVKHSSIFKDMFSLPQPKSQAMVDGADDTHPLVLEGVKAQDFEDLLSLMYPRAEYTPVKNRPPADSNCSRIISNGELQRLRRNHLDPLIKRYGACLSLSRTWLFHGLHSASIDALQEAKLEAIDKVALGWEHHIPHWLREGYRELVERKNTLSKPEAERIGASNTVGVCNLRESRCERQADPANYGTDFGPNRSYVAPKIFRKNVDPDDLHVEAIEEVFKEELALAEQMNSEFYTDA